MSHSMWYFFHLADLLLWLFLAASVAYVCFFALASLVSRKETGRNSSDSSEQPVFLVLFPAYGEDRVIISSIEAFLRQDYSSSNYRLVVISDHMQAETNRILSTMPLTLLQPSFIKSSKGKALQYAMGKSESESWNPFTHVVILDADNIVAPDFLSLLSLSCLKGYQAIQCHRTAKNANNDIAALDGVSEEINNTLFRQAHNNIGLSSALIGSGMCFEYAWFRDHVNLLDSAVEDRELEALLARENIYVKYEATIRVMDEKVSSQDSFQRQRLRWMTGQVQALLQMLPYLPTAIRTRNLNYIDKTFQQALIPRSILLVLLPVFSIVVTVLSPVSSVKWWAMLVCFSLSLLVSVPSRLRTSALISRLAVLPRLVWRMLQNLGHIKKDNRDFIHTEHSA